ncbi:hydroxymethylpyrimidine/phosphomethylpyrimidine kinase [Thermodesulfobacterium hydrogeniphilum]|uniref:hydroxymethylpyrimidine/phosphomethylpyrimidine kinase n=1 Tax=Thermodesulfobacterium hydrogeniphilum TaxID=161156 RepID=UPI0005719160|nr:hydroxymethylpyrimidine/phosphomethylpyrimidine kinase [Thermodesulfobacterium hydrogeniphilum]
MYALSIAGFDPTGGAGILADTKVFSLLGIKGGGVPTTLTLQSTSSFQSWEPVKPDYLKTALELIFSDLPVKGVKIGMIGTSENLEIISFFLKKFRHQLSYIVLDPVLKATLDHPLFFSKDFLNILKTKILPYIDFITPNLYEASVLTERKIKNQKDIIKATQDLLKLGCKGVIIKGYTTKYFIYDYFHTPRESLFLKKKKLSIEFHGTGCAFSSAFLCFLLKGFSSLISFKKAKNWLYLYLKKGAEEKTGGKLWLFL